MFCLASCIKKPLNYDFAPIIYNLRIHTYHVLLNRIDNCSSILISTYFVWGSFLCVFMLFKVQTAKSSIVRNSVNSTVLIHAHKGVFWSDLVCWSFGESCYISLLIFYLFSQNLLQSCYFRFHAKAMPNHLATDFKGQ